MTTVIAHRGASAARPENTVEAFRHARDLGADMVELDARRAADGSLWVLHDAHLADGRALVDTAPADLPEPIPTLALALEACAGMSINLEIKNMPPDPDFEDADLVAEGVVALVAELDLVDRVLISSFNLRTVDRVRALEPRIPTAWLTVHEVHDEPVGRAADNGHVALHPYEAFVDEALIERCRRLGLQVNAWTCDDPERMRVLVDLGIDGICTNVPDVARRVIDQT